MSNILIVDDEKDMRWLLTGILKKDGYTTYEAGDCKETMAFLKKKSLPDMVLLDLKIPGEMDDMDLLKRIRESQPEIPVVMLTGYGNIASAVEAIKLGAYDYLTKPFENERLRLTVRRALEKQKLSKEVLQLKTDLRKESDLELIMGRSQEIKKVSERIGKVASTHFTVLIEGESGTGKEIVANAIHRASSRGDAPFIAVDCGAIPDTLIESELFGYEKGAFTGANQEKKGQFELADQGTIFLDEAGNLPYQIQNKLLRMIQERKIQKLGGKHVVSVDVRIIVASNVPLLQMVEGKTFRSDLYYRLNEFKIELPPLRNRKEDIPFLASEFIKEGNLELQKDVKGLSKESLALLVRHSWPGNVRELKNVIKRAVLLADSLVEPSHLIFDGGPAAPPHCVLPEERTEGMPLKEITKKALHFIEKREIERVLLRTLGNKSKASRLLEIDYKTLLAKIKEYQIRYGTGSIQNIP